MSIIKNIKLSKVVNLEDEVSYLKGQIVSKTLVQDKQKSITIFSFDKDQEIATHKTSGDAIIQVLDGIARVTIDDIEFEVLKGQSIIMPANIPHSVYAIESFKMMLTVVYKYE